jgi:hypothetical protein
MTARRLRTDTGRKGRPVLPGIVALVLATTLACGGRDEDPFGPNGADGGAPFHEQRLRVRPPDAIASNYLVVVSGVPPGTVEAAIDWQQPSQQVSLFVTNPECVAGPIDGVFPSGSCTVVARADTGPKPRSATFTNDRTRALNMFISNFGPGEADVTLTVRVRQ